MSTPGAGAAGAPDPSVVTGTDGASAAGDLENTLARMTSEQRASAAAAHRHGADNDHAASMNSAAETRAHGQALIEAAAGMEEAAEAAHSRAMDHAATIENGRQG